MKKFQWPLVAFFFVGLLQITSCIKTADPVTFDSASLKTASNATVTSEFDNCKLRGITHEHLVIEGLLVTGLFTYSHGNPISLVYARYGNSDGNPNHYFFYDKQNRLREYRIGFYNVNEGYEESVWHRYGYNGINQIIVDTSLIIGNGLEGENQYVVKAISTLTYDTQGRIIKESIKDVTKGTVRNPTFTYDVRGNLAVAGWKSSSYDKKVSIFRAHPVFQFIHRNYSVNNAAPQASYNSKGLPLSLNPSNDKFFNAYQSLSGGYVHGGINKVAYDCP